MQLALLQRLYCGHRGGAAAQNQVSECGRISGQVLPGARMPVDGLVLSGRSHADESMLTGEAEPMLKAEGDAVIGGTMNLGGSLQVRHSCAVSVISEDFCGFVLIAGLWCG